jgi:DNA-binding transcriptional ArsR family regulator
MNVDRILHEPSRLAILATLDACASADFKYLQSATGMSKSNLSMQLAKLEEHGLIAIEKTFVRKTPRTDARLTKDGKTAMRNYWRLLQNAQRDVKKWTLRRVVDEPEPALG